MYLAPGMDMLGNGQGPQQTQAAGLPRMSQCKLIGRFPFAHVDLSEPNASFDGKDRRMESLYPGEFPGFLLPIAVLNVTLKNVAYKPVKAALANERSELCGRQKRGRPGARPVAVVNGRARSLLICTPIVPARSGM